MEVIGYEKTEKRLRLHSSSQGAQGIKQSDAGQRDTRVKKCCGIRCVISLV